MTMFAILVNDGSRSWRHNAVAFIEAATAREARKVFMHRWEGNWMTKCPFVATRIA